MSEPAETAAPDPSSSSGESSRVTRWRATDRPKRMALLDETRKAVGRAAAALANSYAAQRGTPGDAAAIADGYLLGPAPVAALARAISTSLAGRRGIAERRGHVTARRALLERIASPRLTLRVLRAESTGTPPSAAESFVYSDADAVSVGLCLALRELFVCDRPTTLFVPEPLADASKSALSPLVSADHLRVEIGGCAELVGAASNDGAAIAIASPEARGVLSGALGTRVEGFSSRTPSVIAIAPFLYGKDELGLLASHVASELTAPPGPTRGVVLVVGRGWLQRDVFVTRLRAELEQRSFARRDEVLAKRAIAIANGGLATAKGNAWLFEEGKKAQLGESMGLDVVTLLERGPDEPHAFLEATAEAIDEIASALPEGDAPSLVSLFAHPMLHERPTFVAAVDAFTKRLKTSVVGVGTRASIAWSLGGPPLARSSSSDAFLSWMLEHPARIIVEAPLRLHVPAGASALRRRARFEVAPSLGTALALGTRALVLNVP